MENILQKGIAIIKSVIHYIEIRE